MEAAHFRVEEELRAHLWGAVKRKSRKKTPLGPSNEYEELLHHSKLKFNSAYIYPVGMLHSQCKDPERFQPACQPASLPASPGPATRGSFARFHAGLVCSLFALCAALGDPDPRCRRRAWQRGTGGGPLLHSTRSPQLAVHPNVRSCCIADLDGPTVKRLVTDPAEGRLSINQFFKEGEAPSTKEMFDWHRTSKLP